MHTSPLLQSMIDAARSAGKLLLRDFSEIESLKVSQKSINDFVSSADIRSEKIIIQKLSKLHPDYSILSEECGAIEKENKHYTWVIDPLDGTINFLRGIPFFSISIGLKHKKEIKAGVIYDPIHDDIYFAEKGKGAYLNNKRIRIRPQKNFKQGLLGTSYKTHDYNDILEAFGHIRVFSSAALSLAFLATGRIDAFLSCNLKIWDIAAASVLIKEAGGVIDDIHKKSSVLESCAVLSAGPDLFKKMREILDKK